ncbi:MAG TPA: adenylate/guanylate cyclase domain-containing protein [Allocoleopsis sp.]
MTKQVIICVDDEVTVLRSLKAELKEAIGNDYPIEIAEGGEDALELIDELLEDGYEIPLIISDHIMPGIKGDELLKRVHLISPQTLKVMLTGQADIEAVANAIKHAKLYRYITKPWQAEDLRLTVKEAINSYLQDKRLTEQNTQLQQMNASLARLNHEQAKLIEALQKAQQKYRGIFENSLEGIFQTTLDGDYISANSALAQIYGYDSPDELIAALSSIQHQLYVDPHRRTEFLTLMQQQGAVSNFESMVCRKDGTLIWLSENARTIYDAKGLPLFYQGFVEDITARKQAEAERIKFTNELFQLNQAFSRFVPRQFLQLLGKKSLLDVQVGDAVQQEMSVLFSDIRDFTTLSERMTPQENFKFINAYLSRMEAAIIENQGFIDKYIGDAIMALFGGSADDALKAGIEMIRRLADYNQYRIQSGYVPIQIGIGINTGSLMLGTVGGHSRMDSTVISDDVNLASRLEGLTKFYGVTLLISQQTLARLHNPTEYSLRFIEQVTVKGKSKAVAVFEVFDGDEPDMKQGKLVTKADFEAGLFLFHQQAFREAMERFNAVLSINPRDKVAQIYRDRCQTSQIKIQTLKA